MKNKKYDFCGYATKCNVRCTDGRIIQSNAFSENDGGRVPLVWQHRHDSVDNILGHADLENRKDGVFARCSFNDTPAGQQAKKVVAHGDIVALSIYANKLKQNGSIVTHGSIKEVSLVLSGANPEAYIENSIIRHSDGEYEEMEDEAVIYTGKGGIEMGKSRYLMHDEDSTVGEIFDTLDEEQKDAVYSIIADILDEAAEDEDYEDDDEDEDYEDDEMEHSDMKFNIFDQFSGRRAQKPELTYDQFMEISNDARRIGSYKESFLAHAEEYGIQNIDILFPEAKLVGDLPQTIDRDQEWVGIVMNGTAHSGFSRIKTVVADITMEEARALGYIKGNMKKEEVFSLMKRVTTPQTIYKKQKLDRDDIIDITDLDVVAYMKREMRGKLDEEIARAILFGDGRAIDNPDHISEEHIRPIMKDHNLFSIKVNMTFPTNADINARGRFLIKQIVKSRREYKGSGNPTLFTSENFLTDMLLIEDVNGRRIYETEASLASALRVSRIVSIGLMDGLKYDNKFVAGILVNLKDYTVGADRGGNVSMFDDFDIDFNQYKYLIETRCSGCLTKPYSAIVYLVDGEIQTENDFTVDKDTDPTGFKKEHENKPAARTASFDKNKE